MMPSKYPDVPDISHCTHICVSVWTFYFNHINHCTVHLLDDITRCYNIYNITSAISCSAPFYKIMVPTVDTVRYNFLVKALVMGQYPVLLTGPVGTGKTSVAQSVLHGLDKTWTALTVNMSSQVCAFTWSLSVCLSVWVCQVSSS